MHMNKTCRFSSTYNRNRCTYSASFKDLSKLQLTILRTIFRTLCYDGVIIVSDKGFSVPYVSLSCCSPLLPVGDSMTVPFTELSSLAALLAVKICPQRIFLFIFNYKYMSKKDLATIVLKTIIFLCSALLAVLGVSAVTSCAYARDTAVNGRATIVTTDTTYIEHTSTLKYPKK